MPITSASFKFKLLKYFITLRFLSAIPNNIPNIRVVHPITSKLLIISKLFIWIKNPTMITGIVLIIRFFKMIKPSLSFLKYILQLIKTQSEEKRQILC